MGEIVVRTRTRPKSNIAAGQSWKLATTVPRTSEQSCERRRLCLERCRQSELPSCPIQLAFLLDLRPSLLALRILPDARPCRAGPRRSIFHNPAISRAYCVVARPAHNRFSLSRAREPTAQPTGIPNSTTRPSLFAAAVSAPGPPRPLGLYLNNNTAAPC